MFGIPEQQDIINGAFGLFDLYGYWFVALAAFLEGILLVGLYFPGSVVLVLGVVAAGRSDKLEVWAVALVIMIAFYLSALLNYALGRYGWYHVLAKFGLQKPIGKMEARLKKHGQKILFSTYIHPNLGTFTATAAGILKMSFSIFALFSLLAIIFWNTIWTFVVMVVGEAAVKYLDMRYFVMIFVTFALVKYYRDEKKKVLDGKEKADPIPPIS